MRLLLTLMTASTIAFAQEARIGTLRLPPSTRPVVQAQTANEKGLCTIQGEVRNAVTGEPIPRVSLLLRRSAVAPDYGESPSRYRASTDEQGRYAIKDLEPGTYRLSATRTGYVPGEYGAREVIGLGTPLSIDPGAQLGNVILRLTPHAVLAGRIVDERGDPLPYVQVQALGYRYNRGRKQLTGFGSATSNDLGEYRIFGLPPGRFYLSATYRPNMVSETAAVTSGSQAPEEEYLPVYYPRGTDPAFATTIEARPGAQLTGIDFILAKSPAVHIRGRVNNPMGKVLVSVTLAPADQTRALGMNRTYVTDSQGRFDIRGIAPGAYTFIASIVGSESAFTARRRVNITGNVDDFVVSMSPPIELAGRVRAEGDDKPDLSSVRVSLQPRQGGTIFGPLPTARIKSDGGFTLSNISPDEYYLAATELPQGYYLKSVKMGDEEVLDAGFKIDEDAANAISVTLSPGAATVEGAVLNGKGQAAPEATVVLVPEDAKRRDQVQFYRTAVTDQQGRFSITDVVPGAYRLFAWDDVEYDAWMDPDFLSPIEDQGARVMVARGSQLSQNIQPVHAPVVK